MMMNGRFTSTVAIILMMVTTLINCTSNGVDAIELPNTPTTTTTNNDSTPNTDTSSNTTPNSDPTDNTPSGNGGSTTNTEPSTTAAANTDTANADDCPLECKHDSVCKDGETTQFDEHPKHSSGSPLSFHIETSKHGHYCECPDNYTGIRCSRPYVKCDNGDYDDHYCYHGGKCIDGLKIISVPKNINPNDNDVSDFLFCDCTHAEYDGIEYVGKYCEHPATNFCDTNISPEFCINGGQCKPKYEDHVRPCDCTSNFRGPHCEFEKGHVPPCTLQCNNGGQCKLGYKTYADAAIEQYWDVHENFMSCDCPDGYFGPTCDISGIQCGKAFCFNGGSCINATNTATGEVTYACDCKSAATHEYSYGGQYCQSKSTAYCTKTTNHNGDLFCTNGGKCKEDTHEGCDCPEGYHGPICEYHDKEQVEPCDIQCQNNGECRRGTKDTALIETFGDDLEDYNATHNGNFQYCVCPEGYFGVYCEHQLEVCPGGEHVCLHGSKCSIPNSTIEENESIHGGQQQECDCDAGGDALFEHGGKFCQYKASDICVIKGDDHSASGGNFSFCFNGGECLDKYLKIDPNPGEHPGCLCKDGYDGMHCEYRTPLDPKTGDPDYPTSIMVPTPTIATGNNDGNGYYDENGVYHEYDEAFARLDQVTAKAANQIAATCISILIIIIGGVIIFVIVKRRTEAKARAERLHKYFTSEEEQSNISSSSVSTSTIINTNPNLSSSSYNDPDDEVYSEHADIDENENHIYDDLELKESGTSDTAEMETVEII